MKKLEKEGKPKAQKEGAVYQPTEAELAAIGRCHARRAARAPLRFKLVDDNIAIDHPDERVGYAVFLDAFSSADDAFCRGITNQLIGLTDHRYEFDQPELNYLVAMINGIKPGDELEAMLAAQMVAVHDHVDRKTARFF